MAKRELTVHVADLPRVKALVSALALIDRHGCSTFVGGRRCFDPGSGRTRGNDFGADAWCDACIAADALNQLNGRDTVMADRPHLLRVRLWDGDWQVSVDCPHEDMGAKRPCAVWANDDGTERQDECTFQEYADACYAEDWLHGCFDFPPVPIVAAGSGDDWHAVAVEEGTPDDGKFPTKAER